MFSKPFNSFHPPVDTMLSKHTWHDDVIPWKRFPHSLQWRHNGTDCVLNHQPHHCLLNLYSATDQRKHQSSASLAFVRRIHWWPVNSLHKWPVTRKMFSFDDVIMYRIFVRGRSPVGGSSHKDTAMWSFPLMTWTSCWTSRLFGDLLICNNLISNFNPHYTEYLITDPCWDWS